MNRSIIILDTEARILECWNIGILQHGMPEYHARTTKLIKPETHKKKAQGFSTIKERRLRQRMEPQRRKKYQLFCQPAVNKSILASELMLKLPSSRKRNRVSFKIKICQYNPLFHVVHNQWF